MKKKINMKKIFGFSLAEALITLLIVCLITLASVPVLTKKKRSLTDGSHGLWICTRNSNDKYVYFDKNTSDTDINNPDTWLETGTDSCTFVPPITARNFSVTAIGGGGAGGDGVSEYVTMLSERSGSGDWSLKNYTEEKLESDYYDVLVVGGGGGGGGANNNALKDNYQGPGGGGSGSWSYGKVYLNESNTYHYEVGGGGDGGQGRYNGGWKKPRKTYWAGGGGGSSFVGKSGDVNFTANGGGGGEGMGCGGNFWGTNVCGGGAGGSGAAAGNASATLKDGNLSANAGITGQGWRSGRGGNWDLEGGKLNLPVFAPAGAGNGGNGAKYIGNGTISPLGSSGSNGAVVVGQLRKWHATGGEAGEIKNRFVSSMKDKAVITIAPIAKNGSDGGIVQFVLNDKIHANLKITAGGGKAGKSNKNLKEPEAGEDSPWSYIGGGTPGPECEGATEDKMDWVPYEYDKTVCVSKKCTSVRSDGDGNKIKMYYMSGTTKTYLPEQMEAFQPYSMHSDYKLADDASKVQLPSLLLDSYFRYMASIGVKVLFPRQCSVVESEDNEMNVSNGQINISSTFHSCYIDKDTGCYYDSNGLYYGEEECQRYKTEHITEKKYELIPGEPAHCDQAGHGKYFGAGGGGGRANSSEPVKKPDGTFKGLSGKGGNGAPGAVIIEW